ncbi:hypothetical protein [uncultured Gimesia sp.]|uniref:hypothetical protein n=1 Tax=uncultured Gimesia sp. TaxID=1678688 RepID=UPI0030D8DB39|tara:strand:- start:35509 stop:36027 length:519 start_codon:yes stop_codon:yes gene_type:complete
MIDRCQLVTDVKNALVEHSFWARYVEELNETGPQSVSLHIAVFSEPFLSYVIEGKKTIESRFSINNCAPYGKVKKGDSVLIKEVGGPIIGICFVEHVWSYELDSSTLDEIRNQFARALCIEEDQFWQTKSAAAYATLMSLSNICTLKPIDIDKQDQRGWVVIRERSQQLTFW